MDHLLSACLRLATSSKWANIKSGSYSTYKTILPSFRYLLNISYTAIATATAAVTLPRPDTASSYGAVTAITVTCSTAAAGFTRTLHTTDLYANLYALLLCMNSLRTSERSY
jgi:hypothetical protein